MKVHLIETGVANTASVSAAFERLDCEVISTLNGSAILDAEFVILPGVGTFGSGMQSLQQAELTGPIRERIRSGSPTLAICLGMQLLAQASEESPNVAGLGLINATVTALPQTVSVPQFGWNSISSGSELLGNGGYVYFANSYRIEPAALSDWSISTADYGGPLCAAIQRGRVLACQFHPELSGAYGQRILSNWLKDEAEC